MRIVLTVIVAVFLLYSAIAMVGILGMNRVDTGDRTVTSGSMDASYVKNVLVIGTDTRDGRGAWTFGLHDFSVAEFQNASDLHDLVYA